MTKKSKIVFGETATSLTQFSYQALIFITRPITTVQCGAAVISGNDQILVCIKLVNFFFVLLIRLLAYKCASLRIKVCIHISSIKFH